MTLPASAQVRLRRWRRAPATGRTWANCSSPSPDDASAPDAVRSVIEELIPPADAGSGEDACKVPRRVKRLLVLLVLLAGGVAAAALAVPSNAATVNGAHQPARPQFRRERHRRQRRLPVLPQLPGVPVHERAEQLPPVLGAGVGQYAGDHPTATTAFVANYLETEIGHELAPAGGGRRDVSVTTAQLAAARANLTSRSPRSCPRSSRRSRARTCTTAAA